MPPIDPSLAPEAHPILSGLFYAAAALYVLALAITLARPSWGRVPAATAVLIHLAGTIGRGVVIAYFPLTSKMESFSFAALALAAVAVFTWKPSRLYSASLLALVLVPLAAALRFGLAMRYPVPLLYTLWYPLHVPLSFISYGLWTASAAAACTWFVTGQGVWIRTVDKLALQGFGIWSASMIFGGIWGVVAWGAYFLWDPKILWSVILWFHYASFVHLKLTPSLRGRAWAAPALAIAGFVWVLIAYVGTSFFFGRSSHAF